MDKYTELLEKVKEYIQDDNNPEVENGQISLFNLYDILDKAFKELYKRKESEELLKKINEENTVVKKIGRFFKKIEIRELLVEYDSVLLNYSDLEVGIVFFGTNREQFSIEKDLDSNELYTRFNTLTDNQKDILNRHYDEILDILISLQEYRDITGIMDSYRLSSKEQVFSDGFMNIKITYDYYGRIKIEITIEKSIDPEDISSREYARRERIQDVIDSNKLQILKKVVVDENVLEEGCQKILKREKNLTKNDFK